MHVTKKPTKEAELIVKKYCYRLCYYKLLWLGNASWNAKLILGGVGGKHVKKRRFFFFFKTEYCGERCRCQSVPLVSKEEGAEEPG